MTLGILSRRVGVRDFFNFHPVWTYVEYGKRRFIFMYLAQILGNCLESGRAKFGTSGCDCNTFSVISLKGELPGGSEKISFLVLC